MSRCLCLNSNGKQCNRNASTKLEQNQQFCWQHQKCKNVVTKNIIGKKVSPPKVSPIKVSPVKVSPIKVSPPNLLMDIYITLTRLQEHKNLPYYEFIKKIVATHNFYASSNKNKKINVKMMEMMEYPKSAIKVKICPVSKEHGIKIFPVVSNEIHHSKIYTLTYPGGFTKGQLLYELAKIPLMYLGQNMDKQIYLEGLSPVEEIEIYPEGTSSNGDIGVYCLNVGSRKHWELNFYNSK